MLIELHQLGRRFNQEWIFKGLTAQLLSGESCAVVGNNGSGKSTLLQVLSGQLSPSFGSVHYTLHQQQIPVTQIFQHISLVAPYMEIIEEYSLVEMLEFHFKFKSIHPYIKGGIKEIIGLLDLTKHQHKEIKNYSSGMKQRVKLALACCSNSSILLLDEPCVNLDTKGIAWYQELITNYASNRLVVVASNQEYEYVFCQQQIKIQDFKVF